MNIRNKKSSFFGGLKVFYNTFGKPFFSSNMKLTALFLSFFSVIVFNTEANTQQIPSSKLKVVVANAQKNNQNKAKARTVKKKVKKPTAAPKDTAREIDPANTNSPLFEKNQL